MCIFCYIFIYNFVLCFCFRSSDNKIRPAAITNISLLFRLTNQSKFVFGPWTSGARFSLLFIFALEVDGITEPNRNKD